MNTADRNPADLKQLDEAFQAIKINGSATLYLEFLSSLFGEHFNRFTSSEAVTAFRDIFEHFIKSSTLSLTIPEFLAQLEFKQEHEDQGSPLLITQNHEALYAPFLLIEQTSTSQSDVESAIKPILEKLGLTLNFQIYFELLKLKSGIYLSQPAREDQPELLLKTLQQMLACEIRKIQTADKLTETFYIMGELKPQDALKVLELLKPDDFNNLLKIIKSQIDLEPGSFNMISYPILDCLIINYLIEKNPAAIPFDNAIIEELSLEEKIMMAGSREKPSEALLFYIKNIALLHAKYANMHNEKLPLKLFLQSGTLLSDNGKYQDALEVLAAASQCEPKVPSNPYEDAATTEDLTQLIDNTREKQQTAAAEAEATAIAETEATAAAESKKPAVQDKSTHWIWYLAIGLIAVLALVAAAFIAGLPILGTGSAAAVGAKSIGSSLNSATVSAHSGKVISTQTAVTTRMAT
jgi:hypothetical protein